MENPNKKKRKEGLFHPEGKVMYVLTKAGWIILLNVAWLITCIPIITIGTATTSFYYAMIKSVRRDRGNPLSEYFASFKRIFAKGSGFTAGALIVYFLLYHLYATAATGGGANAVVLCRMYVALMVVAGAVLSYLFPVLSRFEMNMGGMLKLAFLMAVRFLPRTLLLLGGTIGLCLIWFYYLPMPAVFFVPGLWCYACTFLIEGVLRSYMPKPGEEENAWYYE